MSKKYLSGGRLGDFIQQLSVVYEHYLQTKEKAIIYIVNKGDAFCYGLETAYEDLKPLLERQDYISSFSIFNGEFYDVDLTAWRMADGDDFSQGAGYIQRMQMAYDVEWGKHRWIRNIFCEEMWTNKVVINTTDYRFPDNIRWRQLSEKYGKNNLVFVGFDRKHYNHFLERTNFQAVKFHRVENLMDLASIVASCRIFVGSLSSPMALAFGMHRPCIVGFKMDTIDAQFFRNFHLSLPSIRYRVNDE